MISFHAHENFQNNSNIFFSPFFSAYIHNNFDQFKGPTILMPYGSAPTTTTTTKDTDTCDADGLYQFSIISFFGQTEFESI